MNSTTKSRCAERPISLQGYAWAYQEKPEYAARWVKVQLKTLSSTHANPRHETLSVSLVIGCFCVYTCEITGKNPTLDIVTSSPKAFACWWQGCCCICSCRGQVWLQYCSRLPLKFHSGMKDNWLLQNRNISFWKGTWQRQMYLNHPALSPSIRIYRWGSH